MDNTIKNGVYVTPKERLEDELVPENVSETEEVTPKSEPVVISSAPQTLEDVIAGLRGFGIEENEEILTFTSPNGKRVRLRITNMPTDEEIKALIAAEDFKGYAWVQRIRIETLSRSISWVDGIDIRSLKGKDRLVTDADGVKRDIQVVLRGVIIGWGQELIMTLWKIAMVHSDKIEKRYQAEFPESTIMTDTERRLMDTLLRELEESNKPIITDVMQDVARESEEA